MVDGTRTPGESRPALVRRRRWATRLPLAIAALAVPAGADVDAQARIGVTAGVEARGFLRPPVYTGQQFNVASLHIAPRLELPLADGRLVVAPFIRAITDRPHSPIAYWRALAWRGSLAGTDLSAGIDEVRWGVSRSTSPVDILNQKDRSFHPLSDSRIGQPMVDVKRRIAGGSVELLAMTRVTPRLHPGRPSRLRGAAWVDPEGLEDGAARPPVELAGRAQLGSAGSALGVSFFTGTSRDPLYRRSESGDDLVLLSRYEPLHQIALDAQLDRGDWAYTVEVAGRDSSRGGPHLVAVLGVVRSWATGAGAASVAFEYIRDSRGDRSTALTEDDVYVEARYDARSGAVRSIVAKLLVDRGNGSAVWTLSVDRALGERLRLAVGTWQFHGPDVRQLHDDGYLFVALKLVS